MKKHILTITLTLLAGIASAQTYTFRQDLDQEINHLVVKGNCVVRLQHDTCNWVAYKGEQRNDTARLVVIEAGRLTTTPAANNCILYVGTSAGKDSAEYMLTFDIEENGMVVYDGEAHTKGHITYDCYDPKKDPAKSVSGSRKYGPDDRLFMDYYFGSCFWNTGVKTENSPIYPTKMSFSNTGVKLGYSFYMDDHMAAGFGVQYEYYGTVFKSPLVSYSASDNRLFTATSDSTGSWSSSTHVYTIGIPLHFTFYPFANRHKMNLQLELLPQLSFGHSLVQEYQHDTPDLYIHNTYTRELPYSLLNLTARLSINFGTLGLYAEYGINPISRNIGFDNYTFSPHHACVGLRVNIFELAKD